MDDGVNEVAVTLLERVGILLYGARWQQELAEGLGVSDRTVRRWHVDNSAVPPGVWQDLVNLARERRTACGEAVELLKVKRVPHG